MNRINVIERDEIDQTNNIVGWFDADRASEWAEHTHWDGNNNVSLATGHHADHEKLLRTAQGRWVIASWSAWVNVSDSWRYIDADAARMWLIRNEYLAEQIAAAGLGELAEESGPAIGGRPAIGGFAHLALGDDLLRQVDTEAVRRGMTRAALVRELLAASLLP